MFAVEFEKKPRLQRKADTTYLVEPVEKVNRALPDFQITSFNVRFAEEIAAGLNSVVTTPPSEIELLAADAAARFFSLKIGPKDKSEFGEKRSLSDRYSKEIGGRKLGSFFNPDLGCLSRFFKEWQEIAKQIGWTEQDKKALRKGAESIRVILGINSEIEQQRQTGAGTLIDSLKTPIFLLETVAMAAEALALKSTVSPKRLGQYKKGINDVLLQVAVAFGLERRDPNQMFQKPIGFKTRFAEHGRRMGIPLFTKDQVSNIFRLAVKNTVENDCSDEERNGRQMALRLLAVIFEQEDVIFEGQEIKIDEQAEQEDRTIEGEYTIL